MRNIFLSLLVSIFSYMSLQQVRADNNVWYILFEVDGCVEISDALKRASNIDIPYNFSPYAFAKKYNLKIASEYPKKNTVFITVGSTDQAFVKGKKNCEKIHRENF